MDEFETIYVCTCPPPFTGTNCESTGNKVKYNFAVVLNMNYVAYAHSSSHDTVVDCSIIIYSVYNAPIIIIVYNNFSFILYITCFELNIYYHN